MFRAVSHVEVGSRRIRASATLSVSVEVVPDDDPTPPRRRVSTRLPLGLTDPDVRWDVLPGRVLPEEWSTGHTDPAVPGSVLVASAQCDVDGPRAGG